MTNGEATQTFQKLGLSEYEARALATLFARHDTTALDISKEASIPYTKIYAVLTSLEKMGLVRCTLERPKKYRPLDPDSVISTVLKYREEQLEGLRNVADNSLEDLKELFTVGERYEKSEKVWFDNSFAGLWNTIRQQASNAKKDIHVVADNWMWKDCFSDKKLAGIAARRASEGMVVNAILPTSFSAYLMSPKNVNSAWLSALSYPNFSCRLIDDRRIRHNVIIVDEEEFGVSFKDIETEKTTSGVFILDKSVTRSMLDYFNMLWEQSMPVENKIRAAAKVALVVTGGNRRKKTN